MDSEVTIERAGAGRIDDLQPIWESLARHHAEVAPELSVIGAPRPPSDSWAMRREHYARVLSDPDAFALIAQKDGAPVAYTLVRVGGEQTTWESGRVAEIETLAVLPGHRAGGIGGALVERVHAELSLAGVDHVMVSVIASNSDAVRFYERLGLTRFLVTYIGNVRP